MALMYERSRVCYAIKIFETVPLFLYNIIDDNKFKIKLKKSIHREKFLNLNI
jgi:hypothetical protein